MFLFLKTMKLYFKEGKTLFVNGEMVLKKKEGNLYIDGKYIDVNNNENGKFILKMIL